ncbi:MAG TPA: aminopeptidase, partial [Trueperaceae bacterium]|nr:aminopeptidase [Trueperaceae bacterium]
VEAHADVGQAALDSILDTDEGSRRLGEVALVPASSPIEKAGVLFYQTLFDENAACHIALGRPYNTTVAGSRDMSPAEQEAVGMNNSLSHVDFMIGSADVDVDGVLADGTTEPVMRRGEWAD